MSKHTPGPWKVGGQSGNPGEGEEISADGRLIAWTAATYDEDEDEDVVTEEDRANAQLIAAAPDLLAVVRMAIDYANDTKERFAVNFSSEDADAYDKLMDAAESAINKAEGRAHA